MAIRPQPYRLEYGGNDPRVAKLVQEIDEMFQILFTDLASGGGSSLSLPSATGILVETTTAGDLTNRTLTAGAGISITNGSGVSGNPTIASTITQGPTFAQVAGENAAQLLDSMDGGWATYDSAGALKTASGSSSSTSLAQVTGAIDTFAEGGTGWDVIDTNGNLKGTSQTGWTLFDSNGQVKCTELSPAKACAYTSLRIL
jgi:hypothetical protein